MTEWPSLALLLSLLLPAAATLTRPADGRAARRLAMVACALASLLAASAAVSLAAPDATRANPDAWVVFDRPTALGLTLYAAVSLAAFALAPTRDLSRRAVTALLLAVTGTMTACAAAGPLTLVAGWALGCAPFVVGPFVATGVWRPRVALAASVVALVAGCLAMAAAAPGGGVPTFAALHGTDAGGAVAFGALTLAIMLRKGIVPFHAWAADLPAVGALPASLLVSGHLGAVVLARVLVPVFPAQAARTFVSLSALALLTALYAAVRAVAEPSARRVLALVVLSQSACILAGLESGTPEGTAGAFIHLAVVALATTALFGILRAVEARAGSVDLARYHGYVQATPRLAVAFAVSGLALLGLPGTLGFAAEDLLVHGSLASHPQVGFLLPLATALNAVCLFRLFGRVFLGTARAPAVGIGDALPRERWALTAILLVLVAGGLVPQVVFTWTGLSRPDAPAHVVSTGGRDASTGR